MLIGTKTDLQENRKISNEEASILSLQLKVFYEEISSKLNNNVNECIEKLVKEIEIIRDLSKSMQESIESD